MGTHRASGARGEAGDCGATGADNRLFVDAVPWLARIGAPWRDLPPELGTWNAAGGKGGLPRRPSAARAAG